MIGTLADVTELKTIETDLKAAKEAADIANRTKDEFLATLSQRAQALECETFLQREANLAGRHILNERLVTLTEMKGGARFHQVVEGPLAGRIKLFPRGILLNR